MYRNLLIPVFLCFAAAVRGQTTTGSPAAEGTDVGLKLDQKVASLAIKSEDIEAALADIGKQVGIDIVLDDEAVELLPWGKQTKLSDVTIANASLRSVLPQILDALGMTYEVRENKIVVVPTEPLRRMLRRPTWDELKLMRTLASTEASADALAKLNIQYRITSKVDAKTMLAHQLDQSGRGSLSEMLETATKALNWVWLVEGDHIVIRTAEAQVANKLARQVTARYTNVPLSQILTELADRADVLITFEPGMMLKLPPSTAQSYTLLLQSVSIRQGLELICAETGLKYEITPDGVHVGLTDAAAADAKSAPRTLPYVGKISIPSADGTYSLEFFIRHEELPADILEVRGQMLQEMIQKIRRDVAPQAPAPSAPSNPGH